MQGKEKKMNTIKKIVIGAIALCAAVPVFAAGDCWTDHAPSQKAQEELVKQMRTYLNQGRVKDLPKAFDSIPQCRALKKSYKENQIPAKCRAYRDERDDVKCPPSIDIESVSQPGFFKKDGATVALVSPAEALMQALKETSYITLNKNPKYLDYNKMQKFAEKYEGTWADGQLFGWARRNLGNYAAVVHIVNVSPDKATGPGPSYPTIRHWDLIDIVKKFMSSDYEPSPMHKMNQWWKEATQVYNDKKTFYKVKWALFENVVIDNANTKSWWFAGRQEWLMTRSFWELFAITPVAPTEGLRTLQAKRIGLAITEGYRECKKAERVFGDCEDILRNAYEYGYGGGLHANPYRREIKQGLTKKK